MKNNDLRVVSVTYGDGTIVTTSMAAHLSDNDIINHYKVGRCFNIGSGPNDNIQRISSCQIIK